MSTLASLVPTLDLADYTDGGASTRDEFIRSWGDALKRIGFVTIEGHGIDHDLIRRVYRDYEDFFALPLEEKMKYVGPAGQRGYTPFGQEHARNRKAGDLKEFYHIGQPNPPAGADPAAYPPNIFPTGLPGFKEDNIKVFLDLEKAATVMLSALAEYMGLEPNFFTDMVMGGTHIFRAIHYPKLGDDVEPDAIRAAEHEDINFITLLCEATSGGLEVLTHDGQWVAIDALSGQIVVDAGDMLSRAANGVIPATTHRVVNPDMSVNEPRYSLPFFCHARPEVMLSPIPGTVTPHNPQKWPDITAGDFLMQRLREIGLIKDDSKK